MVALAASRTTPLPIETRRLEQGALVNQIRSIFRLIAHQKSLNCNLMARLTGRRYF
jgi:hypothetical protein